MSAALRPAAILLSLLALSLGAAGCFHGDDEGDEVTLPTVSTPETTEQTVPEITETTAPEGGTVDPKNPDAPGNDVPPPAGSPQEQFEQFCEQNPGACG